MLLNIDGAFVTAELVVSVSIDPADSSRVKVDQAIPGGRAVPVYLSYKGNFSAAQALEAIGSQIYEAQYDFVQELIGEDAEDEGEYEEEPGEDEGADAEHVLVIAAGTEGVVS